MASGLEMTDEVNFFSLLDGSVSASDEDVAEDENKYLTRADAKEYNPSNLVLSLLERVPLVKRDAQEHENSGAGEAVVGSGPAGHGPRRG